MMSWRKKWLEEDTVTIHPCLIRLSWQTQVLLTQKGVMRICNYDARNAEQESKTQKRKDLRLSVGFVGNRYIWDSLLSRMETLLLRPKRE